MPYDFAKPQLGKAVQVNLNISTKSTHSSVEMKSTSKKINWILALPNQKYLNLY